MARPWEYPGWRRVLMQAVMWAVFAGSLGLAQLVGHSRSSSSGRDVRAGALVVELPDQFNVKSDVPGSDLVADDATGGRRLFVLVKPIEEGLDLLPGNEGKSPIEFRGLHATGGFAVRRSLNGTGDGGAVDTTLLATVKLPRLKSVIVVGLALGDADINAGDRSLFQRFVNGIRLADGDSKPPAPRSSDGGEVRQTVVNSQP